MKKLLINLTGKSALITGGSRGVGRATAILLARAGANVGISYLSREKDAAETVRLIEAEGSYGWVHKADLGIEDEVRRLFDRADQEFPNGLDIFVANAAIWQPDDISISEMKTEQWRRTLSINLDAVFFTTQEASQRLRDSGRIVYVSSTAGQRGEPLHVDYAASKGALISMVKGLCVEFAPRNITVNCVAPGWIDTEMAAPAYVGEARERIARSIPLGRIATPEDVAGPIVFLCSELARHITGEVLNVNGGAILCG